ncbi:MAG TPA: GlsB/YeaQ/YmgE family stress response membrane protein [Ktedonobacterales bacterium]|nr:GlsB/YeaQ/YmgE family stress response membrane protein [Ktedonobacterales bacterium]
MLTTLLVWIIVGGLAGWLASLVVQGGGMGLLGDILVGVVGAILGGILLSALFPGSVGFSGLNLTSFLVAFFGAIVLLLIVRLFTGRGLIRRRV